MQITLFLLLIIFSACSKVWMDLLAHGKISSYDPNEQWKNKWKNGDKAQGEAFPLSSTVLVFLTDRWHLAQFLFLNSLFASMLLYAPFYTVLSARILFGVVFELTYRSK